MTEQTGRILSALDFIESNMAERISLEEISAEAGISPYHFHRIFHAIAGETVGSYIRRRRLTLAAHRLIGSDERIIDIALEYRFESQEAFSRAFKKSFGITPGQYRKRGHSMTMAERKEVTEETLVHRTRRISMTPEFVHRDSFAVVGLRGETTLADNRIPELWDRFFPRRGEIRHRIGEANYGICEYSSPKFPGDVFTDETRFHTIVGVEVSDTADIPEGMSLRQMQESEYAVFEHRGSLRRLRDTYDYIYGVWLPNSEYELGMSDDFELYDERFLGMDEEESLMLIYIPVVKK